MARRVSLTSAVSQRNLDVPKLSSMVIGKFLQLAAFQHLSAALLDLARGGFPHHAGTAARILEAFDQCLDYRLAGFRLARGKQRLLQRSEHRHAEIESLDALRRPVGGDLVARHAPYFFGVGFEEDQEQFLAE